MLDYAHTYGHMPDPTKSWHVFWAGVMAIKRYDARELLHAMIGNPWLDEPSALLQLRHTAYPDG